MNSGNCDDVMTLGPASRIELAWWADNIETAQKLITVRESISLLTSNASSRDCGAMHVHNRTGGPSSIEAALSYYCHNF